MNKAVPWRIKGVGFDARAAAIEAARRSGMSLGEWLNAVIADQAADDGVDEDELDADDRLEAVTRRLSTLRDGRDTLGARERRRPSRPASDNNRNRRHREDDVEEEQPRDQRPRSRPMPRETFEAQIDAERLLENAIAAFDRRANRSSERTARALAEVAELIDAGHRDRDRDDKALATIADRLSDIERRVAREPAPPRTDRSIQDALVRLERRIEKLAQRPAPEARADFAAPKPEPMPAPPPEPVRAPVQPEPVHVAPPRDVVHAAPPREPVHVAPQPQPANRRPLAAAIAEVARRQQELDGTDAARAFGPPGMMAAASLVQPPAAVPSPLEARLTALIERLEKGALQKAEPPRADISGLQGNIDALTGRIEKMRGEIAARNAAAASADTDQIAHIRRELAGMSRSVADLAPRTSVAALETAVRDLSARVAESRIDGVGEAALAPVESLVRELMGVVRSTDPRGAIESLDRGIRAVATKLEAFDGASVADPELARGIAEQTRELHGVLARIHDNQLPGERIEQRLADLAARVDSIATSGADPLGRGEMAQCVGEIRAMLADPIAQERTLQTVEQRLEGLATHVGAMFGERFDSMQRTFAAELDRARNDRMPDVDTLVHDLGARLDTALAGGLKAMEKTVARLVETAPARPDPSASRLEEMVRGLAARVDANATPGASAEALDALNRQITQLAEHFDRNDKTAETLVGLHQSIGELFTRLDEARPGVAEPSPEVTRELADLRSLQDAADHRTHATLTAVHDTLSQVVNRLSSLEDDLADVRESHASMPVSAVAHEASTSSRFDSVLRAVRPDHAHAPALEQDEPDVLIEPGAAFDRRFANTDGDGLEERPQASFIQAARRAAQAATVSAEAGDGPVENAPRRPAIAKPATKAAAPLDQVRAYYESRKRPILLSLAALMMIFGAWQIARVMNDDRAPPAPSPAAPSSKSSSAPVQQKFAEKPAAVLPTLQPAPSAPASDAATPQQATADPPAESAAPSATAAPAQVDRMPVGSLPPKPESTAETNGIVRALAVSGDPAAQYELAVRYADGKLLARDLKLSKDWFEKASAKGVVPAQYRLGAMYERGIGVNKDPAQAKLWYQRAADAGNARAMHNLAVLFADGAGGSPDYASAIVWFRKAAELGVRDSEFNLAILYARGMGTPVNMVESYLWFAAAAAQGDEDSAKKRDEVAARLQPNDLSRAKALAASFKPRTPDPAANDVMPPPGGWEAMKAPPRPDAKPDAKPAGRPKVSAL